MADEKPLGERAMDAAIEAAAEIILRGDLEIENQLVLAFMRGAQWDRQDVGREFDTLIGPARARLVALAGGRLTSPVPDDGAD